MKIINLSQGQVAIVDDEDFEELNKFKWYADKRENTFYAVRNTRVSESKTRKPIWMHRIIMDTPKNMVTDHVTGDGLDNRKLNLRIVNRRQNTQNKHINKSSIFPGVCWHKSNKKWVAHIRIDGKQKYLGLFNIEVEAFNAYLKVLNDINEIIITEL